MRLTVDIETCVDMLNNVILTTAKPCKIKFKNNNKMKNKSPWYDSEYVQSRKKYDILSNKHNRTVEDTHKKNRDKAKVQLNNLTDII